MSWEEPRDEAEELLREAYHAQLAGDFDRAAGLYRRSIDVRPTAEAHTFLGWTYSFQKRYDDAIRECERAIEVDPDFGNPYNDIGAYFIELGRLDDAVPWLQRAKKARRYEPRHFPFVNLARIYVQQGRYDLALDELKGALRIEPNYPPAEILIRSITAKMN